MITYKVGDATRPIEPGPKLIVHIVNTAGGWGAGFVLAVSRRWPEPEQTYRRQTASGLVLGSISVIKVEPDISVVNMVAQKGYGSRNTQHRHEADDADNHLPPIRYEALETCLGHVASMCANESFTVVMPRIGCDLAGGSWGIVEKIIEKSLCDKGIPVSVYDLPGPKSFRP